MIEATAQSKRERFVLWGAWWAGALIFPIAAKATLKPERLPFPRVHHDHASLTFFLAIIVGFSLMAVAMFRLRAVPLRTLLVAQMLGGVIVASTPAMASADPYMYLAYGDVLAHGGNPWQIRNLQNDDSISEAAIEAWGATPPDSRYGPAFVAYETLLERAFPKASVKQLLYANRLIGLVAAIGITATIRGPAIRFWALNPMVLYYFGFEAHNDVVFMLCIAIAMRVRNRFLAGILIGVGGMIKIIAFGTLAFRRYAWQTILGALAVAGGLAIATPKSLNVVRGLSTQTSDYRNSIASLLDQRLLHTRLSFPAQHLAIDLSLLTLVILCCACVRWNKRDAASLFSLIFIAALPVVWPWYFAWPLFASVATAHRPVIRFVTILSLFAIALEATQFINVRSNAVLILFLVIAAIALYADRQLYAYFQSPRRAVISWARYGRVSR